MVGIIADEKHPVGFDSLRDVFHFWEGLEPGI